MIKFLHMSVLALAAIVLSLCGMPHAMAGAPICLLEPSTVYGYSPSAYSSSIASLAGGGGCVQVSDVNHNTSLYIGARGEGGVRINSNLHLTWTPIYKYGVCRYVMSASGNRNDFFIPINSPTEWSMFLQHPPSGLVSDTCAFPTYISNAIGPTTINYGMGDSGDQYHGVSLPFYPTSYTWPSTGTYNDSITDSCYKEYHQYKCWRTCTRYWDECWTVDDGQSCSYVWTGFFFWPVCVDNSHQECVTKSEDYCCDEGSTCEKEWHSWTESFSLNATAGNGEASYPGWSASSWRTGGSRPDICNVRCNFTGHDCYCPGDTPTSPAVGACGVPAEHPIAASCVAYGAVSATTVTGIAMAVIVANSNIDAAVAAGDCNGATSQMNTLNNSIDNCNAICDAWWAQYCAQH